MTTGRQLKKIAENLASKEMINGNEDEAKQIMENEFQREKENVGRFHNIFRPDNIKDIENQIYKMGKYEDD